MIKMTGVSRTFLSRAGRVDALTDINLTVAEGEFVAVVGRSGCGKSTLLRMAAGLVEPTSGSIEVNGSEVVRPRRDVALVFQRPALLPWRSVVDNVLLPIEMFGLPRRRHLARAMELLDLVGLDGFQRRRPHELSGGMQQRVALCRALIQEPRVMLMDEPFSALDALTREELATQLQQIHLNLDATTVLVTHSIDEAVLLADRVIVLTPRPGQIRTVLTVDIPRPRSLGRTKHIDQVARCTAELHELLVGVAEPTGAAAPTPDTGQTAGNLTLGDGQQRRHETQLR